MPAAIELSADFIARAKAGDRRCEERMLARLRPIMHTYFIKRIGLRPEVDDLIQNTLLRVHNSLKDLEYPERFMGFAMKAALYELHDLYRGRYSGREVLFDPTVPPEYASDSNVSANAVDAERASEALSRFDALFRAHPGRLLNPIGLRLTAGDGFTLSPSFGRTTLWMDVFYYGGEPFVTELATLAEELGARCHWGKTLPLAPEVMRRQYPGWEAFREARQRFDPSEVFANPFTDRIGLTGDGAAGGTVR